MRRTLIVCLVVVWGIVVLAAAGPASAARWRSMSVPIPAGASSAALNAVSCASVSSCWAVGTARSRRLGDRALAEHWDGRRWQINPVPSPAVLRGTGLFGVDCNGPSACMAVGATSQGGTLGERWNGRAWSVVATPSPAGSSLSAISCPSASDCLAVGNSGSFDSTGIFNYSLNLAWNGTDWTREPFHQTGFINGVSCPSATFCAGVGNLADSGGVSSVTEQWNGTAISDVPSGDDRTGELQGVSCVSAGFCMAVGTDEGDIVLLWNGRRWRPIRSPGGLDAVWCLRSNLCLAAGAPQVHRRVTFPPVAWWNGTRWAVPHGSSAGRGFANGVTCAGPSDCLAVGSLGSRPLAVSYG